jgi:hypothetical protein
VEGEFLIADLHHTDPSLLEIADVICCPGSPLSRAPEQVLDRYPGVAVVAAPCGGGQCRIVTRTGHQLAITVTGPAATGARATMLGAMFVHCWLTGGCPAVLVELAGLVEGASESLVRWSVAEEDATCLPFDFYLN